MPAMTPVFLFDVEKNMRMITETQYARFKSNLWWSKVAKEMQSGAKSERISWLLDTATIQYVNRLGGEVEFSDVVSKTTEYTSVAATAGLKLPKAEFEDADGQGVDYAAQWSRTIGEYAAYWPQKQIAAAIRNGGASTSLAYDGQVFFSSAHPINPFDTSVGTYANDLTGGSSGTFPGACPIDTTNVSTLDVAFTNLNKVFTYMRSILMPNGEDPRMLRGAMIVGPPALSMRLQQLTNAKLIAQAAATGGGSGDVEAVISDWGVGQPVIADELGAAMPGGSDTTYYVIAQAAGADPLGAFTYVNREPFSVIYHGPQTDAQLARMNDLQWVTRGRNVVGYGHPYMIFRCQGT